VNKCIFNSTFTSLSLALLFKDRLREIKAWKGVGKIPKQLTRWEQRKYIRSTFLDESEKFVLEQKALAELEAKAIVHARHQRHLEERTVSFVFDMFLSEVREKTCVKNIENCI
jgi:hypothetical protein